MATTLPEPSFIERDAEKVTSELVALYESLSGRVLQPAQLERLMIDLIAYRENLLRIQINEAAKQCLVEYATYPALDYLGELVGVPRLPPAPARTTLRFTLVAAQTWGVTVPAGTRVDTKDGKVTFATDTPLVIAAGQVTGDVSATATTAGVAGNGYLAGDVTALVDPVAYVQGAANTTMTFGGAEEEGDERYRSRIKEAPEKYSTAGSRGAYRYWAMTAHQSIVDVAVLSPSPGVVNIYPLTTTGNPTAEIIALVAATVNADKIRPLTDQVSVLAPTQVDFSITAGVTLFSWADAVAVQEQIGAALALYAAEQASRLGKDIVSAQIVAAVNGIYGVYNTSLSLRDGNNTVFTDKVLADNAWGNCTARTVTIAGYVNG